MAVHGRRLAGRRGQSLTAASKAEAPASVGAPVLRSTAERFADELHALAFAAIGSGSFMNLFREGFERDNPVVAVGIELTQLLDVAEAIFWADEHAVASSMSAKPIEGSSSPEMCTSPVRLAKISVSPAPR